MLRISVLVSGGGSNLQAIIDAIESEQIKNAMIVQVISSKEDAYALERAIAHSIKSKVIGKVNYPSILDRTEAIINALDEEKTDLVVLAGYMSILRPEVFKKYKGKIINIHPSLIPKFCGEGYYGIRVHKSVIEAGEIKSGATVHYVDEGVDTGEIIIQREVDVVKGDTPSSLAERVLKTEHEILPISINIWREKGEV